MTPLDKLKEALHTAQQALAEIERAEKKGKKQEPIPSLLPASDWLPLSQAAALFGSPSPRAFRAWAKRHGITPRKVGQKLFYQRAEIEGAISGARTLPRSRAAAAARAVAAL